MSGLHLADPLRIHVFTRTDRYLELKIQIAQVFKINWLSKGISMMPIYPDSLTAMPDRTSRDNFT